MFRFMRILYFINAGIMGGRERHVHTLVKCLPSSVTPLVCTVSAGEATDAMTKDGIDVRILDGTSGHDWRIIPRFIRLLREFKPDIIHAHSTALFPFIVLKFLFPHIPVIESLHGPAVPACGFRAKLLSRLQRHADYFLPVSQSTWADFKRIHPAAHGEVFLNALNLSALPTDPSTASIRQPLIIGMVGRMADVKDWPSFVRICAEVLVARPDIEAWAIGDGPVRSDCEALWIQLAAERGIDVSRFKWFGSRQDARELIAKMNVFVLTSKSEQLPTTMLEAFALKTPVVGFLPEGGTQEILDLAKTPCALLHPDRDISATATDIIRVLNDQNLQSTLTNEGYRIVTTHFDMRKLCATQLINIYTKVIKKQES